MPPSGRGGHRPVSRCSDNGGLAEVKFTTPIKATELQAGQRDPGGTGLGDLRDGGSHPQALRSRPLHLGPAYLIYIEDSLKISTAFAV
jgi:hypothetical protein